MNYKKNTITKEVIINTKHLGEIFSKVPWIDATEEEYNIYINSEKLKLKKELKKNELRQKHIDNLIKTKLDEVDNAINEEELNDINL